MARLSLSVAKSRSLLQSVLQRRQAIAIAVSVCVILSCFVIVLAALLVAVVELGAIVELGAVVVDVKVGVVVSASALAAACRRHLRHRLHCPKQPRCRFNGAACRRR